MVCVPCVLLPFLLFIWHKFLQPIVLTFWNPWQPVQNKPEEAMDNSTKEAGENENNINKCLLGDLVDDNINRCPLADRTSTSVSAEDKKTY